jgi:glyoxylase-like metal-dependent hydrolase (beta-lactamase superfamily II)
MLADPKTSAAQRAEIARAKAVVDHPERIAPDHVIAKSGSMSIAGRRLDVHLAKFAATEGDVWLYDPRIRVAIVGDLVVGLVPYMDTACADGWSRALDQIAATPFQTLIPGHGAAMNRPDFLQWRAAYSNFIACGRSSAAEKECVAGWQRDAAKFIEPDHKDYVAGAASYYIETRLRSSPQEQQRYCKPLSAPTWRKPAE